MRNTNLSFICRDVYLHTERTDTAFTNAITKRVLRLPIAHGEGNYFADDDTIKALEDEGRILFRYSDSEGNITAESNPNGSLNNIAGIMNKNGNVFGMMPHPERAADAVLGNTDGLEIFKSVLQACTEALV